MLSILIKPDASKQVVHYRHLLSSYGSNMERISFNSLVKSKREKELLLDLGSIKETIVVSNPTSFVGPEDANILDTSLNKDEDLVNLGASQKIILTEVWTAPLFQIKIQHI